MEFHLAVAEVIEGVLRRATQVEPSESLDIDFSEVLATVDGFFQLSCSFLFLADPVHADQLTVRGSTTLKLTPFGRGRFSRFDSVFLKTAITAIEAKWMPLTRTAFAEDLLWTLLWQTMELGPYARGCSVMVLPVGFDPNEAAGNTGYLILIGGEPQRISQSGEGENLRLLVTQLSAAIEFGNSIRRAHDHLKEVTERLAGAGEATQLHNIFSPLQRIELHADLLRRAIKNHNPDHQRRYLDLIRKDAWEASRFTKGILDLRKRPMASTVLDNLDMARAAFDLESHFTDYADVAGKRLIVRMEDSETCTLAISKSDFDEIASNLIHNAIKYGYRNTKIKVSFRRSERDVLFDVTSYGIEIAPDDAEKIFELGYRTQDAARVEYNAVGFGLYWARKLARKSKGHLYLVSSTRDDVEYSGYGKPVYRNTFRLRIPVRR